MAPNNFVPIWGNEKTMNLNSLVLANIQASPYFKVQLYELKTYHEVIDEIYYRVSHLEPWEKGSRRTAGQTGMCGGVRGVGAGGIVSSAYCLLYKLLTLKLTRKQIMGLMNHGDSPFIRGLGFMYIRYTQAPQDLWQWFEDYLDDEEEIDVKAGGGGVMSMGEMLRQWLTKLEWFSTLFPRIPVPIQKDIEIKMKAHGLAKYEEEKQKQQQQQKRGTEEVSFGEAERNCKKSSHSPAPRSSPPPRNRSPRPSPTRRTRSPRRRHSSGEDFSHELDRERDRQRDHRRGGSHERRRERGAASRQHKRHRSRSKERNRRSRSRDRRRH